MLSFPKEVTYNIGDLATIIIKSDSQVFITSLIDPNLKEIPGFPLKMKHIKGNLYISKIQIPNEKEAIGSYICQIGSSPDNAVDVIIIRVVKGNIGLQGPKRVTSPD